MAERVLLISWADRLRKASPYLLGGFFIGGIILGMVYLNYLSQLKQRDTLMLSIGRDYSLNPFDWLDAQLYCQRHTEMRYGDSLTLTYVDQHSTRIDPDTGIYKMFMVAHIGTATDFEEASVHCFIDPDRQMLTHYRTVSMDKDSLMSRAIRFFGI